MVKRLFDICFSIIAVIFLFPVLVIVYGLVLIKLGSPAIYRQKRPGLHGRTFFMYKFRTMTDELDADGQLLPDEIRLTQFGSKLRSSSLDELPGFFNVIKGDMSLVGPRPLLTQYLPLYTPEQARRHEVKPGITGLAQVSGRNTISWNEKFSLDVWYVDNRSFWLDIKILALTIRKVFAKEGVVAEGHVTTHPFKGNSDAS